MASCTDLWHPASRMRDASPSNLGLPELMILFSFECILPHIIRPFVLTIVHAVANSTTNPHTAGVDALLRNLGERIRDLRKQRGWSQAVLAENIGVHYTYLGHLERAEKPGVSLMSVSRVAAALGVTLSELFAGLEYGADSAPSSHPRKPLAKIEVPIRVGKNAIRIEKLIEELRRERETLRDTVRTLKKITERAKPEHGRSRKSTTEHNRDRL